MTKNTLKINDIVICGLFVALIAIGAFIKVPVPFVPFTLQTLFTTLAGLFLGGKKGFLCVFVYMILGLIGLPIFASGGGPGYIFQPSFGYIIGFAVGAFLTGTIAHKKANPSYGKLLFACFAGLAMVYLFGMIYYYIRRNFYLGTGIGLWPLFLYCFLLVVPGDIVMCFFAAMLGKRLIPVFNKRKV